MTCFCSSKCQVQVWLKFSLTHKAHMWVLAPPQFLKANLVTTSSLQASPPPSLGRTGASAQNLGLRGHLGLVHRGGNVTSSLASVVCVCTKSLQLCPNLCNSMDSSLSGSSVHGILQARFLEWAVTSSSRGPSQPRDPFSKHGGLKASQAWMSLWEILENFQ